MSRSYVHLAATLRRLLAAATIGLWAAATPAQPATQHKSTPPAACPPVARMPTAPQLRDGQLRHARDRGFLWRITKDDRHSYLYGTIHVGRFEWAFPGPTVIEALHATDALALEVDLGDPQGAQRAQAAMARPAGAPPLPPALAARLQRQIDLACLPAAALASLHPVMQAMTLAVLAGRWDGLDPAYGQEQVLAAFARATQRGVVGLETPELQMAALLPPEYDRAQAMVGQLLGQIEEGSVRRQMQRLGAAWEAGDLETFERYETWCECVQDDADRAFMRQINDDRNPGLADRIDALHREGRRVFAAVGALHMAGPKALPAQLRERGYEVQRIPFPR